jgi:hypothetical protein
VIERDLATGQEIPHSNVTRAANAAGITTKLMCHAYLNRPRHLLGKHWRTPGAPYWEVTSDFIYDPSYVEHLSAAYIKRVDTDGGHKVYESRHTAAKLLEWTDNDLKQLRVAMQSKLEFHGGTWSPVLTSEMELFSSWHEDDSDHTVVLQQWRDVTGGQTNESARCDGYVFAHDVVTGKDLPPYTSYSQAAQRNEIHPGKMKHYLLNKPRLAKGRAFRTVDATMRWQVPPLLRFNKDVIVKANAKYIVAETMDGTPVAMYEGAPSAGDLENIDYKLITAVLDTGRDLAGFVWRTARTEEYETFVPVPQPP